jgi:hypothetical protein
MSLYSVPIETLRRCAAGHRAPRTVKQRTYVFFLVPFGFSKNGNAKKAEIPQGLINGHTEFDRTANYTLRSPLALRRGEIGGATETTPDGNVDYEPQLDSQLMWTWVLPNPL